MNEFIPLTTTHKDINLPEQIRLKRTWGSLVYHYFSSNGDNQVNLLQKQNTIVLLFYSITQQNHPNTHKQCMVNEAKADY